MVCSYADECNHAIEAMVDVTRTQNSVSRKLSYSLILDAVVAKDMDAGSPEAIAYRNLKLLLLPLHAKEGKYANTFSMIMKHLLVRYHRHLRQGSARFVQPNAMMTFVGGQVTSAVPKHLSCVQQATLQFIT